MPALQENELILSWDLIKKWWKVWSPKSEDGSRKSEGGSRKSEVGSRKSEVGSRKSEVGSRTVIFNLRKVKSGKKSEVRKYARTRAAENELIFSWEVIKK